ncbi:hypothetical protein BU24DRAFT_418507 [Aaosphaeria arxii CBS 175.79]|uniref:Uncharacterized protein n=1 Tax=Aaosphaeria arxii CBS 175.79 TaxID=1450172 RepID=A0A6A5Y120_9PLEO|nr:uncharacterized protein BU24DRAFT_418507 [Aaosphaeria arxii CBS 175.79]KAF2018936.1 hypothetical protein BU24DRAFT_418507 [Aaosphaeria arxii CBS 175.79]
MRQTETTNPTTHTTTATTTTTTSPALYRPPIHPQEKTPILEATGIFFSLEAKPKPRVHVSRGTRFSPSPSLYYTYFPSRHACTTFINHNTNKNYRIYQTRRRRRRRHSMENINPTFLILRQQQQQQQQPH